VQAALDREPLAGPAQWQPGQLIAVGRSLLGLAPIRPLGLANAAVKEVAIRPHFDQSAPPMDDGFLTWAKSCPEYAAFIEPRAIYIRVCWKGW
jgi:hypothetical protein